MRVCPNMSGTFLPFIAELSHDTIPPPEDSELCLEMSVVVRTGGASGTGGGRDAADPPTLPRMPPQRVTCPECQQGPGGTNPALIIWKKY